MVGTTPIAVQIVAMGLAAASSDHVSTTVIVDDSATPTPFPHYWNRIFGSGHAWLTLRPDWQHHLRLARDELGLGGVRYHGIFDDDMGVVTGYRQYNFTLIDKSWDYQVSLGLTPVVELSFMPAVLANCSWTGPDGPPVNPGKQPCSTTTFYYKALTMHPTDFDDWYHLVHALGLHAVNRYGAKLVSTWHWEVWNELWGMDFPDPYMQLFNASSMALKAVHPSLKVGGPATMQLLYVADFIDAAEEAGITYDFVSTHMYPTDPRCTRGVPWSRDCFTNHVKNASKKARAAGKPFYMTEYNVGCCPDTQSDTSGGAAFAFQEFGQLAGHTDMLSWWTFSDVFEEGGLPKTEFRNEFGLMTLHGIRKPAWRAFELAHAHAGIMRVPVTVEERSPPPTPPPPTPPPPPPGTCAIFPRMDISGDDILPPSQHLMLPSVEACCDACFNHTTPLQCSAWAYGLPGSENPGRCYLKTSTANIYSKKNVTSGSTGAPRPQNGGFSGPAVSAFATVTESTTGSGQIAIFLSFWNDGGGPDYYRQSRSVTVQLKSGALPPTVTEYRIDARHANPQAAWVAMGSPPVPSADELERLNNASKVTPLERSVDKTGAVTVLMDANSAVLLVATH